MLDGESGRRIRLQQLLKTEDLFRRKTLQARQQSRQQRRNVVGVVAAIVVVIIIHGQTIVVIVGGVVVVIVVHCSVDEVIGKDVVDDVGAGVEVIDAVGPQIGWRRNGKWRSRRNNGLCGDGGEQLLLLQLLLLQLLML